MKDKIKKYELVLSFFISEKIQDVPFLGLRLQYKQTFESFEVWKN